MTNYAHITGWGMSVPKLIITNDHLSQILDTTDKWIQERTGIQQRHIADHRETTASLASEAALRALRIANLLPKEIDLIIVATSTPEHIFPATACLVQDHIGAINAGAFDLSAACTGFIYGLNLATQSIRSGSIKNAIVIGSETLSRIVDWGDRDTCILFGDGAGAFVVQASDKPGGVRSAIMRSDGSGGDLLTLPAGGSALPASTETINRGLHYIKMSGREVFRFATRVMEKASREVVEKANLTLDDIALFIPHQANIRIIKAAAHRLNVPLDRFFINLQDYGNTSTASIPIATCEAIEKKRLNAGDYFIMVGFGAGLTWGAVTGLWTGPFPTKRRMHISRYRRIAQLNSLFRRIWRRIEGLIWGRKNTT